MSSSDLIRWGELVAMLSGVVWVTQSIFALTVADPDTASWLDALFVIALLLTLSGLHTLQKGYYGRVGQASSYLVIAASVAQILGLVVLLTVSEALAWLLPLGGLGGLVGFVLYDVPPYKRECCRIGAK